MPSSYALGKHYETYIKNLVDSGRYASASEVVRAAMREFEVKEGPPVLSDEYIRAAIAESDAMGGEIDGEEFFAEMRAKYGGNKTSNTKKAA
jgi:antitoxin ParD1/3/4